MKLIGKFNIDNYWLLFLIVVRSTDNKLKYWRNDLALLSFTVKVFLNLYVLLAVKNDCSMMCLSWGLFLTSSKIRYFLKLELSKHCCLKIHSIVNTPSSGKLFHQPGSLKIEDLIRNNLLHQLALNKEGSYNIFNNFC